MPTRPAPRRPPRHPRRGPERGPARPRAGLILKGLGVLAVVGLAVGAAAWAWGRPERQKAEARALLAEARTLLAADRAARADAALEGSIRLDPGGSAEAWRLRLEILRVEDRPSEAIAWSERALGMVPPGGRRGLLRAATAAVLAEVPDDQARDRLGRWVAADPGDTDARVALANRMAAQPRAGDPPRSVRIAELAAIVDRDPARPFARAALGNALADAGEVDEVRRVLTEAPAGDPDPRLDLLRGHWELDHDGQPGRALASYRRAVAALPHDWKAHYGLARALRALGREPEARAAADAVARLRERLDPATLGPRLRAGLEAPDDDPRAAADLAALCDQAGLATLAEAWRAEAARP